MKTTYKPAYGYPCLIRVAFALYVPRIQSKEIGMDATKPAQNIQDSFLNTARKDKAPITIYLMSGVKLTGRIRSFDKYSVVLETNNQEQLIFKHAISTVVLGRGVHHASPSAPASEKHAPQPAANEKATGTES